MNFCFHRLASKVLYALHDIYESDGKLQVLVTHSQTPAISAVFVISPWKFGCVETPEIYASAHLIGNEQLPTFSGPNTVERRLDPRLIGNSKFAHQRRAMIVKSHRGDDSLMLGLWTGRRPGWQRLFHHV